MKNLLLFMVVITGTIFAQQYYRTYEKKISLTDIYKADSNNQLFPRKYNIKSIDTLYAYYLNGKFWLPLQINTNSDNNFNIFGYDPKEKRLIKIQNFNYDGEYLFVFNELLFAIKREGNDSKHGKVGTDKIVLIDIDSCKIKKEISLLSDSWVENIETTKDSLYIFLQPMKREDNLLIYRLLFFVRDRPERWHFKEDGDPMCYIFDSDFLLKRIIKVKHKEDIDIFR